MSVTMIGRDHQIGDWTNSRHLQEQRVITDRRPHYETTPFRMRPMFFADHCSYLGGRYALLRGVAKHPI